MDTSQSLGSSYLRELESNVSHPFVPLELLEQILGEAWLSPMTPAERKTFVKSVSRTSKIWSETLARVCTQDIYTALPSSRRNRCSLEGEWPFHWRTSQEYPPFQLCRSYTQQSPLPQWAKSPTGQLSHLDRLNTRAFRDLLSTFRGMSYAPNLCKLSVEYFNTTTDNNQKYLHTVAFCLSVLRLEVEYTFPSETPAWLIDHLGLTGHINDQSLKDVPWGLPDLDHISTWNNDPSSIGKVLKLCPHLEIAPQSPSVMVKILLSSDCVPEDSAIVHGPLSFSKTYRLTSNHFNEQGEAFVRQVVRGRALGLVLESKTSKRNRLVDVTNTSRHVALFRQRSGPL